jgi:hypothetical protein
MSRHHRKSKIIYIYLANLSTDFEQSMSGFNFRFYSIVYKTSLQRQLLRVSYIDSKDIQPSEYGDMMS